MSWRQWDNVLPTSTATCVLLYLNVLAGSAKMVVDK